MEDISLDLTKNIQEIEVNKDSLFRAVFQSNLNGKLKRVITITHTKKNIESEFRIKFIVNSKDPVEFIPTIIIKKGATGVKSKLKIEVLNLTNNPHILISPNMEILDNDVEASHSLAIRQVDSNELKYLMSRGLEKSQSTRLLIQAFINDL